MGANLVGPGSRPVAWLAKTNTIEQFTEIGSQQKLIRAAKNQQFSSMVYSDSLKAIPKKFTFPTDKGDFGGQRPGANL